MASSMNMWTVTSNEVQQVRELIDTPFYLVVNGRKIWTEGFKELGQREIFRIETIEGHSVEVTEDQKFLVEYGINQSDFMSFPKALKQLKAGDTLRLYEHKNIEWDGNGSLREGCLAGLLYGDGNIHVDRRHDLNYKDPQLLICSEDHKEYPFIKGLFSNHSDLSINYNRHNNCYVLRSPELMNLVDCFDIDEEKIINVHIESASSNFQRGFLSTFFDCDAHAHKTSSKIDLVQADLYRLQTIQRMLLRFGINSSIYKGNEEQEQIICGKVCSVKSCYHLVILKSNVGAFNERIGFNFERKRKISEDRHSKNKYTLKEKFTCRIKNDPVSIGIKTTYVIQGLNFDYNGFVLINT